MPIRGTAVLPSEDTATPETPVPADVLLTPADFGIAPRRMPFTPAELAPHFNVSARTIQRMIEDGRIRALMVGGVYKIPYSEVVMWFLRQQGSMN